MSQDTQKREAAQAAIQYIKDNAIVGIGTGSTINYFIEALANIKGKIEAAVSSSKASTTLLKSYHIPVYDLNSVSSLDVYIDSADEVNPHLQCIKGGGGALTGEKIVASVAKQFVCIVDQSKKVNLLGKFPVAVEVLPLARSYVARQLVKLGGDPIYREGFVTDHGNSILDVHHLELLEPLKLEQQINNIAGVVANGIFAQRCADILVVGNESGVDILYKCSASL